MQGTARPFPAWQKRKAKNVKKKVTVKSGKRKITEMDRKMAKFCIKLTVCSYARKKQQGAAFWFVQKIEGKLCPFCKAYERVYAGKPTSRLFERPKL